MGLAGMILTKETYLIHVGCAAAAAGVCYVSNALSRVPDARPAKQTWDYVDLAVVIGTGAVAIVFFYSGTFFHWSGVKGLYQAYAAWFETGHSGHGHEKPWYYWLKLIARYEWPVLVGLLLCLFCQQFKNVSLRYLAIYGVGTLIAYSIVKYKTPWCIISFVWPFLFMFGAGVLLVPLRYRPTTYKTLAVLLCVFLAVAIGYAVWKDYYFIWPFLFIGGAGCLLIALRHRRVTYILSAITLCASFGSTIWLNYLHCTTETEPYVYVQTYNDVYKLTRPVLQLAKRDPAYYQMVGHIIRPSAYPLPWILDDFPHIGYYEQQNLPTPLDADFLLVQQDRIEEVEAKLKNSYFAEPLTIRPYQDTSKLYLSAERFKSVFPGRKPNFTGKGSG